MRGQSLTIGQAGEQEQPLLRPLPEFGYDCSEQITARLTPYSQIIFDTNRYSVLVCSCSPRGHGQSLSFRVESLIVITSLRAIPAVYERNQDIFDPFTILPLLKQRPGAFDFAAPMKRWRKDWPECYHRMLRNLREKWPEGRGIQEFVRILQLHEQYSPHRCKKQLNKPSPTDASTWMGCCTACIRSRNKKRILRLWTLQIDPSSMDASVGEACSIASCICGGEYCS